MPTRTWITSGVVGVGVVAAGAVAAANAMAIDHATAVAPGGAIVAAGTPGSVGGLGSLERLSRIHPLGAADASRVGGVAVRAVRDWSLVGLTGRSLGNPGHSSLQRVTSHNNQ